MWDWYDEILFLFGPPGHTHNGIDATHNLHNNGLGRYFYGINNVLYYELFVFGKLYVILCIIIRHLGRRCCIVSSSLATGERTDGINNEPVARLEKALRRSDAQNQWFHEHEERSCSGIFLHAEEIQGRFRRTFLEGVKQGFRAVERSRRTRRRIWLRYPGIPTPVAPSVSRAKACSEINGKGIYEGLGLHRLRSCVEGTKTRG
jgi:hypothetical protein